MEEDELSIDLICSDEISEPLLKVEEIDLIELNVE